MPSNERAQRLERSKMEMLLLIHNKTVFFEDCFGLITR
ncbi:hypothetical protein BDGGKGIB_03021 [Nodularia sphaerocarpa UHCC 0038]|nr:hypothetical protein BDGGKGIB_03021 [Nodularia sphaerocarpa UHCC 0038]